MTLPDAHRYCIYCGIDCEEYEPEHAADCSSTTGLYPVTEQDLGIRGPNDPYAHGMVCMDCGAEFKVGEFYTHRQVGGDVREVICAGCRVLDPEAGA